MGFAADILYFKASVGGRPHERAVDYDAGVGDEVDVHLVVSVGARFKQSDLTASTFFCGRAEDDYLAWQGVDFQEMGCG